MGPDDVVGVLAHPGGLLAARPELTVGVVRATSTPTGLQVELLARRPPDERSAVQRQADIRARRDTRIAPAPRRLLPEYDEGMNLRFGWLDGTGRAHWSYPSESSCSSGGPVDGGQGPSLRADFLLPPLFDRASWVLAWPEIGFPETVVTVTLPDRATVERETFSIWQAPVHTAVPGSLTYHDGPLWTAPVAVETGQAAAPPRVLHRGEHAVVVLTRLTAVGRVLSMQLRSLARGPVAGAISATAFPPRVAVDDAGVTRVPGRPPRASVAVLHGDDARWLASQDATTTGGEQVFEDTSEFVLDRPDGDVLDLLLAWPAAGLPEVRVHIPIRQS